MDRLIRTLWRQSHAIGFAPSITCAIAWIASGGAFAKYGLSALPQSPILFWFCLILLCLIVAFGALVSFWILMSHLRFRKLGYQINWLTEDEWTYEERRSNGLVENLRLSRKITGDGYPAPCSVYIQGEKGWDQQVPEWAHGRRTEIVNRIAEEFGGRVLFCDADPKHGATGQLTAQ